jgi:hypothetical protein
LRGKLLSHDATIRAAGHAKTLRELTGSFG